MNYIILDLEWNQGAAEKTEEKLPFEIIEIGAIKLNDRREKTDEFNELIKPQVYHEMNYITRKLIHLQMDLLYMGLYGFSRAPEKYPVLSNGTHIRQTLSVSGYPEAFQYCF